MLRDMTDSKRIDLHIQSQKEVRPRSIHPHSFSQVSPVCCSSYNHISELLAHTSGWWAEIARTIPGVWILLWHRISCLLWLFFRLQDDYAKEFITFKPDKQLRWLPHLGTVHLEVELRDRTVEAETTPLEAAIIELFSEKGDTRFRLTTIALIIFYPDTWTVDELMPRLGSVDLAPTVKALNMWADKGVLIEEAEACYKLLEITDTNTRAPIQRAREYLFPSIYPEKR